MKVSLIGKGNIFKEQSSHNKSILYAIYFVADVIAKEGRVFKDPDL
jgi:hypothetical protein